jgi:hypothetical protein
MRRVAAACVSLAVVAPSAAVAPSASLAQSAALAQSAVMAQDTHAVQAGAVTRLMLPHPLAPGEIAWIEVQVGAIARGREIEVTTASGQPLGVISPFGVRLGQDAGTYTLPVPPDAIRDGAVAVRLAITQPGRPPRPPTAEEVRSVTLAIGTGTR